MLETISPRLEKLQGYGTHIWVPECTRNDPRIPQTITLVHDRRNMVESDDSKIYVITGTLYSKLGELGLYGLSEDDDTTIKVPSAMLWGRHGAPCQKMGAEYFTIPRDDYDEILRRAANKSVPIITEERHIFGSNSDQTGPYDLAYCLDTRKAEIVPFLLTNPEN